MREAGEAGQTSGDAQLQVREHICVKALVAGWPTIAIEGIAGCSPRELRPYAEFTKAIATVGPNTAGASASRVPACPPPGDEASTTTDTRQHCDRCSTTCGR